MLLPLYTPPFLEILCWAPPSSILSGRFLYVFLEASGLSLPALSQHLSSLTLSLFGGRSEGSVLKLLNSCHPWAESLSNPEMTVGNHTVLAHTMPEWCLLNVGGQSSTLISLPQGSSLPFLYTCGSVGLTVSVVFCSAPSSGAPKPWVPATESWEWKCSGVPPRKGVVRDTSFVLQMQVLCGFTPTGQVPPRPKYTPISLSLLQLSSGWL